MKCKNFYSIQYSVDGFGHDTATWRCYETEQSAKNALKKAIEDGTFLENEAEIVKQTFNHDYIEIFD